MSSTATKTSFLRIIAINDVYKLANLPKIKTLVHNSLQGKEISRHIPVHAPEVTIVTLAGDFLSPSLLSSLDKGKSMVDCLNRIPVTHVCFGNREADLKRKEIRQRISEFENTWLNSNVPEFDKISKLPRTSVVELPSIGAKVGLIGLLLAKPNVFKDDKFFGCRINDVLDSANKWTKELIENQKCSFVVPLTHQSLDDDIMLARRSQYMYPVLLGGHEHHIIVKSVARRVSSNDTIQPGFSPDSLSQGVTVATNPILRRTGGRVTACVPSDDQIRDPIIVKTGSDATCASVIDLEISDQHQLVSRNVYLIQIDNDTPSDPVLKDIVQQHLEVLSEASNEVIIRSNTPLSSKRMRMEPTTIGTLFATAIKEQLFVDACMLNGAPIKGDRDYPNGEVTYLELKEELPFPTKIVRVPMTGSEIVEAVQYARSSEEERAYMQVDEGIQVAQDGITVTHIDGQPIDLQQVYQVALPRNLLGGFCRIEPLMHLREVLNAKGLLPDKDSFTPAFNLIVSYFAKVIWSSLGSFDELDLNQDGKIAKDELIQAYQRKHNGKAPSDKLVKKLFDALDDNATGFVERQEFESATKDTL